MENRELSLLKSEFLRWSGFELTGESAEEMQECVKSRLWDLECELNQQAKYFNSEIERIASTTK